MVFNENTNYDFNLLSKQDRTQLIYSTELNWKNRPKQGDEFAFSDAY